MKETAFTFRKEYHGTATSGMTLVELMVAMAILAVFMGSMMTFMARMTESVGIEEMISDLDRSADNAIQQMAMDLRGACVTHTVPDPANPSSMVTETNWATALNAGDNTLKYLIPVDADGDGDFFDDDFNVQLGVSRLDYNENHFQNNYDGDPATDDSWYYTVYRFVQSDTFDEAARSYDLNNDGDQGDTFPIGHIEKAYPICPLNVTNDVVVWKSAENIVIGDFWPTAGWTELFELNGAELTIRLAVVKSDAKEPIVRTFTSTVLMRNEN